MITRQHLAALEFGSLPMLGWLAAAVLPWLIHRWQRRQHQTTSWAAVELLLSAMQRRARRVQMQQWLLLAVRTAILVLVALAVAEPALRQWAVGAGGTALRHQIVVVDQSYSMGCVQDRSSRWQRAQAAARQWIKSNDGDAVTLIGWSGRAENLLGRPTFDESVAMAALSDLQLSQSSSELPDALRAIFSAIDRAEVETPRVAAHQVVFCTDMGRQTWHVDDVQRELMAAVAKRANVRIVNVATGPSDNLAITEVKIEPVITLAQREAIISATISCFGEPPSNNVSVELLVEGRRVDQQQLKLRKDGESTARFSHRFVNEGSHTIQAVLANNADCLTGDDERWMIVDVQPRLRVACFAGQPGSADDLGRALAPDSELNGPIETAVFSISQLRDLNLSNYAAILLGSVADLSKPEAAVLAEYVRQGGGLAIFLGQSNGSDPFGELQQLLPVQVGTILSEVESRFDPLEYRHPIVAPFRGQAQSGLLGVIVSQYRQLKLRAERPSTEVVLKFDTGDPAVVVDNEGLGRIAVCSLPASLVARTANGTPWSTLALSPSFLPVVRELVAYLVGDRWLQQHNLLVGETAVFPWDGSAKTASVQLPMGASQTVHLPGAEDRRQMLFQATGQRGVYRFSSDDTELARFAVNLDGRDSDLKQIDLATLPEGFNASAVEATLPLLTTTGDFSFVRTLLAAALGLLLLEIGLAWQLGKGWG